MRKRNIILEGRIKSYLAAADINAMSSYEKGLLLLGAEKLYAATEDSDYADWVMEKLDTIVLEDGAVAGLSGDLSDYVLGNALYFAVKKADKYEKAAKNMAASLAALDRTDASETCAGIFSREAGEMYYTQPFYMNYETKFGGKEHYNDIIAQYNILREKGTATADLVETPVHFAAAAIDTMEVMEQPLYEIYDRLKRLYKESVKSLINNYSSVLEANINENTCLFAYEVLKGCRMKALQTEKYEEIALTLLDKAAKEAENGLEQFDKCTAGAFVMAYAESLRNREYQDYGRTKGGALWS